MTNPTATIRNSSQMVLARNFALCRRIALACVALVLSFAVFALNRSARASEPTLLAQAPESQDVIATNGAGPCQVAKQYVSLINKGQYGALGGLYSTHARDGYRSLTVLRRSRARRRAEASCLPLSQGPWRGEGRTTGVSSGRCAVVALETQWTKTEHVALQTAWCLCESESGFQNGNSG
jgi:hypothetical protein